MQLVEQGLIDLDAPMSHYLPEDFYKELGYIEPFTMRDLLNHSAGFSVNMFDNFVRVSADDLHVPELTFEETMRKISANTHQIFSPGTGSAYSNFGVGLAGLAVEYVSGQPLYQYQREHILNPLGMSNSALLPDWSDNSLILSNKAQGYLPTRNGDFRESGWLSVLNYAAGNLNASTYDMALFGMALLEGKDNQLFINDQTLSVLFSPSYDKDDEMVGTYHGFLSMYVGDLLALGHGGNSAGFTSSLVVVPEKNFGFVFSINGGQDHLLTEGLYDLLLQDLTTVTQPIPLIQTELPNAETVAGRYVVLDRFSYTMLEVIDYMGLISVEAINSNTILVSRMGGQAKFIQVAPFVFELAEVISNAPPTWRVMNRLTFGVEDGQVYHVYVGGWDFTPLPSNRRMSILAGSLLIVVLNVLMLLIMPIVLIIKAIRRKKRKSPENKGFYSWGVATKVISLALVANNLVLFLRVATDQFGMLSGGATIHIVLNYLFGITVALCALFVILSLKKGEIPHKSKVVFAISTAITALFIIVLISWNFFTL